MTDANTLPPLPAIELGTYRHYKGHLYDVLGVARHSESLEPFVVYRPQAGNGSMWIRPWAMFCEQVEVNGVHLPRFERL